MKPTNKKFENSTTSHDTSIDIIDYQPIYKDVYKHLNYEWLTKYFDVESSDEKILANPDKEIINKHGHIFFARKNNTIIGTCTLIRHDATNYELSKMCVTEPYQQQGVGEQLLDTAIATVQHLGGEHLFLFTNKKLAAAYHLYKKKGFKTIHKTIPEGLPYKRCSICMSLNLTQTKQEP